MATAAAPAVPAASDQAAAKTDWSPTAKVSVGALAGAGTTLLLVILKANNVKGIDSAEVGAAITTLITFLIQYTVPERSR